MTRRTGGIHHTRRVVVILAFTASLLALVAPESDTAGATAIGPADAVAIAIATADASTPTSGGSGRPVVRIGALVFALGSIAAFVAAGSRRNPVRGVDADGRDL